MSALLGSPSTTPMDSFSPLHELAPRAASPERRRCSTSFRCLGAWRYGGFTCMLASPGVGASPLDGFGKHAVHWKSWIQAGMHVIPGRGKHRETRLRPALTRTVAWSNQNHTSH